MLPVYIALVPYNYQSNRDGYKSQNPDISFEADLFHVCAALQTQVTRDFAPLWGETAVVSPFLSLDHVPVGHIPIVIVPSGALGPDRRVGFHLAQHTRPFAVVEYGDGWSLLASHELLEIIVDPLGARTVRGASMGDVEGPNKPDGYTDQGEVEYLLEICDPCQWSTYTINGVLVSDFVTPQYYDPFQTAGARYSFTGRLDAPWTLLAGGYITWATPADHSAWQAFAAKSDEDEPPIADVGALSIAEIGVPLSFSRDWVDSTIHPDRPALESLLEEDRTAPLPPAADAYVVAMEAAASHAEAWRNDVRPFVDVPKRLQVDEAKLLKLLERLGAEEEMYGRFQMDPQAVIEKELEIELSKESVCWPGGPIAPMSRYRSIAAAVRAGELSLRLDMNHVCLAVGGLITH